MCIEYFHRFVSWSRLAIIKARGERVIQEMLNMY